MKKLLVFALGFIFIFGIVSAFSIPIKQIIKSDFTEKLTTLDSKNLCLKEKQIKELKRKRFLGITFKTYQELKCIETNQRIKTINSTMLKRNIKTGVIKFKNE